MKKIYRIIAVMALIACLVSITGTKTEAKTTPKNGIVYEDEYNFRIYKSGRMLTGWVRYKGKTYYLHKTNGERYKRGQATRNECRIKSGKYYYFGVDGSMAEKSTSNRYSIFEISKKTHAVTMIYRKRGYIEERYNCRKGRYERQDDNGRWILYKKMRWGGMDTQK